MHLHISLQRRTSTIIKEETLTVALVSLQIKGQESILYSTCVHDLIVCLNPFALVCLQITQLYALCSESFMDHSHCRIGRSRNQELVHAAGQNTFSK